MALSLTGCGLESLIILESPEAVIRSNDSKFEFNSTAANGELEFRGYEIFYKLYLSTDIPASYYTTVDDLIAASYHRLSNPDKDRPGAYYRPLINVDFDLPNLDRGEPFTVLIDFSNSLTPIDFPKVSLTGALLNGEDTTTQVIAARRWLQKPNFNELKRFTVELFTIEDVSVDDTDLSEPVFNEIDTLYTAQVVCFAVSWGVDINQNLVYSIPEWLGFESIRFPQNESTF